MFDSPYFAINMTPDDGKGWVSFTDLVLSKVSLRVCRYSRVNLSRFQYFEVKKKRTKSVVFQRRKIVQC